MVGASDRDLPNGRAESTEQEALFANFGPEADAARRHYDPRGDQTLDELKRLLAAIVKKIDGVPGRDCSP